MDGWNHHMVNPPLPPSTVMPTNPPMKQPLEFSFAADVFNLELRSTEDGERTHREQSQSQRDRAESIARQTTISPS